MTKKFNSVVAIHKKRLKIAERRTLRHAEETEAAREEMLKSHGDEYDIVVTYGGPFNVIHWMKLRELKKTEINE
jgi:hypothetical protein